ncbi:hypothetical protein BaRGS_00012936 [Batillaria attramentaria]|uniref:STIL centriolar assembly protein n=1 Tax=Batillaria attramentaria TaxID=370345 RepID=A0ABD0L9G8_9CAEN
MPEHIRAPHLADLPGYSSSGHQNGVPEEQQLLQFPKSTCVLWDGSSTGQPVFLHVAQHRKPKIHVSEKVLWLIHRQCDSEGSSSRVLVGSLSVDDDAEGVCFHIDGLDTRQSGNDSLSDVELGDVMIPVQVSSSRNQDRTGTVEDYLSAVQMLKQRVCGREALELSSLLLVKGWCSFYSNGNSDKTVAHLQFDVVTLASVLKATPVNAVPIVPTALAKNLAGPRNLSNLQGRPKSGFLTMDHTRKLLLVLDSDPKVSSLPIVGIWVSGVPLVQHPFVWTACLRYLHTEQLQDRVCTPPEGFLLVMYSPLHSKPEFYEKSSGPDPASIQWEVCPVRNGPKRELFDAAIGEFESQRRGDQGMTAVLVPSTTTAEDIMPRSTPAPHRAKAMVVRPMVPEVSMLWNEDSQPAGFPPFPSAPVKGHHLNSARNGPYAPQYPSTATSVPQARSQGSVPTYVNDVIVDSNSNNNCQPRASSQQYNVCASQQGIMMRHPSQERMYMQNGGFQPTGNFVHPAASAQCSGSSQPSHGPPQPSHGPQSVNNQLYNAYHSQGYPAPQTQGQTPVPASSMQGSIQPQFMPSAPGSGYSRLQPSSTHFVNQQPLSVSASSEQGSQQQQFVPCGGELPRSAPPPSMVDRERPHLVPPSSMHLCRPALPQQSAPSPQSLQNFQGPGQIRPSRNIPYSQGQILNQQQQCNQPYLTSQPQQQTSQPLASAGQHLGHSGYPSTGGSLSSHIPIAQGSVSHLQFSHQVSASRQGHENEALRPYAIQGSGPHFAVPETDQGGSQGMNGYPDRAGLVPSSLAPKPSRSAAVPSVPGVAASANITVPFHPSVTQLRDEKVQQVGNDMTHADSTSCSGKSSDDSGLSVTPDCSDPSPKAPSSPPHGASGGQDPMSLGIASKVNWEGVPPEVVQLLVQQDAQLKVLQAQIQQLLAQQQSQQNSFQPNSVPTPEPSFSSNPASSAPRKVETCSTAVNTTLFVPEQPSAHPVPTQYASVQTSPQKPVRHDYSGSRSRDRDGCGSPYVERVGASVTPSRAGGVSAGQTPSEIRHQGAVQLNSTRRDDGSGVSGLSVGSISSDVSLQQQSQGHSSPARLQDSQQQGSMSHSTPSPQSASMCGQPQEGEESKGEEVSPDSKEYYDQLISNIRLFLNNHSKDTDSSQGPCQELPSSEETYTQLKLMDSTIPGSPSQQMCPSGGSTNTTLLPHINYLSMMLECETDTSVEINAMAMKYLKDEELTQMARLRQGGPARFSGGNLLRQVLAASADATSVSDSSRLSASASNLSMATKKYLEKYGLMGAGDESLLDTNQTIRLQTDFSMAMTSEPRSGLSLPPSPQKGAPQTSECSAATEDDRILDIEKLKQMPKLL